MILKSKVSQELAMKKWRAAKIIYFILDFTIAALLIGMLFGLFVPKLVNQYKTGNMEKLIVGTWEYDIDDGYGTGYYTFSDSGSLTTYYEYLYLPEGIDTSSFGTISYSIEDGDTLVLYETLMGLYQEESFSLEFINNDTMVIDGVYYYRSED